MRIIGLTVVGCLIFWLTLVIGHYDFTWQRAEAFAFGYVVGCVLFELFAHWRAK